ncbi:MAG: aminodeoxychorismate/anthranilate synthase component II [Methanocellales archaeon]|nr:aminodeoxychorismate/anthranilate synthase component II [Methanocellales archaeon]
MTIDKQKVLVIDNYDSFVYNLVQYIGELGASISVMRNDVHMEEIETINPDKIVISPGPGRPENSGVSLQTIKKMRQMVPILGVCLGHQAIGYVFGAEIAHAKRIMHGKTSKIYHDGEGIFKNVKNTIYATRYHSLIISPVNLPDCLKVSAKTDQDEIMGIRHKYYPIEGVQFHPESILTEDGRKIIRNFLEM